MILRGRSAIAFWLWVLGGRVLALGWFSLALALLRFGIGMFCFGPGLVYFGAGVVYFGPVLVYFGPALFNCASGVAWFDLGWFTWPSLFGVCALDIFFLAELIHLGPDLGLVDGPGRVYFGPGLVYGGPGLDHF